MIIRRAVYLAIMSFDATRSEEERQAFRLEAWNLLNKILGD